MVSNIVLRNLTTPPVKGTSAPLISTKVGQRDGTRSGGGGGGGGGGTPAGLYNIANMTLLGTFKISHTTPLGGRSSYGRAVICFNPPNGSNGTFGSLFFVGRTANDSPLPHKNYSIGEFQIPETLSNSPTAVFEQITSTASVLQEFIDIRSKPPLATNANNNGDISWLSLIDGKLWGYTYNGYAAGGYNTESLFYLDDSADLANANAVAYGTLQIKDYSEASFGNDYGGGYCGEIPAEFRALFNNHTHYIGNGTKESIIGRQSDGPSLLATTFAGYTPSSGSVLTYDDFVNFPIGGKGLGELSGVPDPEFSLGNYSSTNDTFNQAAAMHYLQNFGDVSVVYYHDNGTPSAPTADPIWQVYKDWHESSPRVPWDSYPPPSSPLNNLWNSELSKAGYAFFVPGTKTFLAIGHAKGHKYGGGYKVPTWDQAFGRTGGPQPFSEDDFKLMYWAWNVDDIVAAANYWEIAPYSYGELTQGVKDWFFYTSASSSPRARSTYESGALDTTNNRLYMARRGVRSTLSGEVQPLIDVYQL